MLKLSEKILFLRNPTNTIPLRIDHSFIDSKNQFCLKIKIK